MTESGSKDALSESVIEVRGLNQCYSTRRGGDVVALEDVDLTVKRGEFLTIVGPSGCGKTTLLKILGGLVTKTSGEALYQGTQIDKPRREVGFVFQSPVLFPWRTVLNNAMLPVEVFGLDHDEFKRRALDLLELVGLTDFANSYPNELSGGMQQRAAIVRALVTDPTVLLMDEPFGALDAMSRERMNLETMRIASETGKTVVFVTHSIPEAVLLGDRVVVMTPRPGRIAEICEVDIPRPRSLDVTSTEPFYTSVGRIRSHFKTTGVID